MRVVRSQITWCLPFFLLPVVVPGVEGDLVARCLTREGRPELHPQLPPRKEGQGSQNGGGAVFGCQKKGEQSWKLPLGGLPTLPWVAKPRNLCILQPCGSWAGPGSQSTLNV